MSNLIRNIKQWNSWAILSLVLVIIILLPSLFISIQFFTQSSENWQHIKEYLLTDYIYNTVIIVFFTGIITTFLGISMAWFIAAYDFPLKKFFKWGMILPLAIPPYIGAYTYHGILNYTGIIQSTLRNSFDIEVNQKYFNIMTIPGAIFIFTAFLFPYVFIISRSFLERQSTSLVENARLLGSNSFEIFFRVVLPISRGAMIGGVSLVILEVLNDYGVVKYFGIPTFSTAIFQTWFGMGDIGSAIKLSVILMSFVIIILIVEKLLRGRKKFSFTNSKVRPMQAIQLTGIKAWGMFSYFLIIFLLAFFIPFVQLIQWTIMTYEQIMSKEFLILIWNSTFVAFISAFLIISIALIIANFNRLSNGLLPNLFSKIVVLGYSIPGAVIAIGVLILFIALDQQIFSIYQLFGQEPTLILSVSIVMLIFAYVIRFLAVGYNSIESGFSKVGLSFTEASRTLGMNIVQTFFKVDIKMISGAVIGGFILAFIEILKELPLTMILQPFNFYTLATKAFQYAGNEMIHEASLASLFIIIVSGISIYFFHKISEKETS